MTTNINKLKVGSRESKLARIQVGLLRQLVNDHGLDIEIEHRTFRTTGDEDRSISLTENSRDDFFTDRLDEAVLSGEVDIAVHSAKDLPDEMRKGLSIYLLTESSDSTDAFAGETSFFELPDGAKVGTSSLLRRNQVKQLNPGLEIVDIRGTIEERLKLVDRGVCDGIIVATVAMKRLGLEARIANIMPWEGAPLQGQLAVVGRADNDPLRKLFAPLDVRRKYGKVTLVGAGPGDPELITVKGVNVLKSAECVFYDYLAHKDLLDHAPRADKIYVGKRKGEHTLSQSELSRMVREKAMAGVNVVRLKGGDPLVFGRGAEEISYLRSYHIQVEVVPGVSSATSIPSSLGVPLTARDLSSSVAFISGHGKEEKKGEPQPIDIPDVDTIVFLMGLTKLDVIVRSLLEAGWAKDMPVMVISRGTCVDERIVSGTIETIEAQVRESCIQPPALIVAGQTVKFWKPRSEHKESILYTGTDPEQFRSLGSIIHLPMIQISRYHMSEHDQKHVLHALDRSDMLIFTSRYAVWYFFELLTDRHYDVNRLRSKTILTIGQVTERALNRFDFRSSLQVRSETSEGLLGAIKGRYDVRGKNILFPRSSLPNPTLKDALTGMGAVVEEITIYQNTKLPKRELPKNRIDKILFTSPSTVRNFLEDYERIPHEWTILSKGPVTQRSLKEAGYDSEVFIYE